MGMKTWKLISMTLIVLFLCDLNTVAAETIQVFATKNIVKLKTQEGLIEGKDVKIYIINDRNFFRLRDIAMLIDFNVEWNDDVKEIKLNLSERFCNLNEQNSELTKQLGVVSIKQSILVDDNSFTLLGYNIDGYNYFSIEDLSHIASFNYNWDKDTNTVSLSKNFNEDINPADLNELIKEYIENDHKQKIIEENNVRYNEKSKDYTEIEKYIKNNMNPQFNLKDFVIEEYSLLDGTVIDSTDSVDMIPLRILDIRYYVGKYCSSFGYQVTTLHGYAKMIDYVGEWNDNFNIDKIKFPTITDEELKKKAAENYADFEITGYKIVRFFDMDTLEFKAAVSVSFIDSEGYHASDVQIFIL